MSFARPVGRRVDGARRLVNNDGLRMMSMVRRVVLGASLAALIVAALLAQDAPTPQGPAGDQPAVTFKVEVNYVEVDAAVFDRQKQPVSGLKRDDFEVYEDGVRQDVSAFTQVNIPIDRPEPVPLQAKSVIEPDVVTNAKPFDGRLYVIILDDKQTQAFRAPLVKRAAEQFVSRYMAANDLAAVLSTSGQSGSTQEFTSNKRLLLRAIDKFMGIKLRSETEERLDEYQRQRGIPGNTSTRIEDPVDMQRGYDARISLETLTRISDWVGSIRGRRKAIVLLQRRHRLQHLRLPEARGDDHPGTDAGRHCRRDPLQRQHLLDRPARPHLAGRRVDQRLGRIPRRSVLEPEPAILPGLAAHLAGQPAEPVGGNRRLRGGQPERLQQCVRESRPGQQLVLRPRLLPEKRTP